ncbi:MAG TPA: efflux RND transporter periplasmic adaptor subunit [Kofleriaceae bacterium]|nr:efflux RND transporter periplasmic adaptor subunit [Kofleriaceae bacterium]
MSQPRSIKEPPPPTEFTAVVTARKSALISAQVAGPIQKLTVRSGQLVKAGDLVVALDKTELSNKLVQAQFAEESARSAAGSAGAKAAALRQKAVAEKRLLKLGVSTPIQAITSQDDYAATGAEAAAASSKAAEAKAQRELTEKELAKTDITAPMDGIVTNIKVHEGQVASAGMPLARVFDPSDLILRFAVPKEHRAKIKLGQRVQLDVDGNARPVWATVTTISQAQEPPINFTVVEADIDDTKLAPGELTVASVGRVRIADARDVRVQQGAKP